MCISAIPIKGMQIVKTEEGLWDELERVMLASNIQEDDIIVMAHTPFSRVQGPIFDIESMVPRGEAIRIGKELDKDPKKVEIVLRLSKAVIKVGNGVIISKNHADIICANAGVDESNAGLGKAIGVPVDPDALARQLRDFIQQITGKGVAVIISDTVGRALRLGAVNIAIGVAGILPILSEIGKKDLFGYEMKVSTIAIADEIAGMAELLQGQTSEGVPAVIVRGYKYLKSEDCSAKELNRPDENRLFR